MFYDDKSAIHKIVAAKILHTVSIAVNLGVGNQSFIYYKRSDHGLF